jgi:hypothetical protein
MQCSSKKAIFKGLRLSFYDTVQLLAKTIFELIAWKSSILNANARD